MKREVELHLSFPLSRDSIRAVDESRSALRGRDVQIQMMFLGKDPECETGFIFPHVK